MAAVASGRNPKVEFTKDTEGPFYVSYYRTGDKPSGGELDGVYKTREQADQAVQRIKNWAADIDKSNQEYGIPPGKGAWAIQGISVEGSGMPAASPRGGKSSITMDENARVSPTPTPKPTPTPTATRTPSPTPSPTTTATPTPSTRPPTTAARGIGGTLPEAVRGKPVSDAYDQIKVNQALADQRDMLLTRQKELQTWDAVAQDRFKKSFGVATQDDRKYVQQMIDRQLALNERFAAGNFRYAEESKPGRLAYVRPSDPNTVYLDQGFFHSSRTGFDSMGGTLIHEFSHFNDVVGSWDVVYGPDRANDLAGVSGRFPRVPVVRSLGLWNADNLEYYFEKK